MPTYLYCVLLASRDPPAQMPAGIGGGPVRALRAGAIAAWVESVSDRALVPTLDRVRTHDAVADVALATGVTPLPVRFGQTFASDDECLEALRAQEPRLVRDLERVDGLVEMRLVIALADARPPDAEIDPDTPGRAYMQRLLRTRGTEQSVNATAATVRAHLSALVQPYIRGEEFVIASSPTAVLTVSHLVARGDVARYRAAVNAAAPGAHVARMVVCGPVAPYQFVSPPA